jgi:hypothetical protein
MANRCRKAQRGFRKFILFDRGLLLITAESAKGAMNA